MTAAPRGPRVLATIAAALAAAALVLLPALPAAAHDYLISSSPASGSTVRAPLQAVTLTFDAAVLNLGRGTDGVVVTGPGAGTRHFETGCAVVQNATVSTTVALGAPGRYSISWRVVSADGHPVSDTITFDYAPPAGTEAGAGSPSGPDCGVKVPNAAQPSAAGGSGIPVLVIVVTAAVALLLAAALIATVVVLRRGDRSASPERTDGGRGP